jgi:hypothetical protein
MTLEPRAVDQQRSDNPAAMDQPHPNAALGLEPIRTIGREELKAKLDRGEPFKLIMALNRWAFDAKHIPGSVHFDTPDELYAAVRPDDEVIVYARMSIAFRASPSIASWSGVAIGTSGAFRAACLTGRTPGCRSRASSRPRHEGRVTVA